MIKPVKRDFFQNIFFNNATKTCLSMKESEESDEAILEEGNVNLIAQEDDAVLLTPTTLTAPKVSVEK